MLKVSLRRMKVGCKLAETSAKLMYTADAMTTVHVTLAELVIDEAETLTENRLNVSRKLVEHLLEVSLVKLTVSCS